MKTTTLKYAVSASTQPSIGRIENTKKIHLELTEDQARYVADVLLGGEINNSFAQRIRDKVCKALAKAKS